MRPLKLAAFLLPTLFAAHLEGAERSALTLEERVDCRAKVEDVYWAHRIWPKDNRDSKPSREAVLSRAAIRAKVVLSLQYEAAIEEIWRVPLSPEVLQAEMDRQARQTQDPAMLRELHAALGNDAYLVAECLVRPELAQRRIRAWYASDRRLHAPTRERAERDAAKVLAGEATVGEAHETLWIKRSEESPETPRDGAVVLDEGEWRGLLSSLPPTGVPSSLREGPDGFSIQRVKVHASTEVRVVSHRWPKVPLEVWWRGRAPAASPKSVVGDYRLSSVAEVCADDTWARPAGLVTQPEGRFGHTAIWTGSEMIVWGGGTQQADVNTGGRYTPSTDTWAPTNTANAPSKRVAHTAVWTGSEMIIWGGGGNPHLTTGARYHPSGDTWTPTNSVGAPTSIGGSFQAVWTGSEMLVWGGYDGSNPSVGGRYSPSSNVWTALSAAGAPSTRFGHTLVWTGSEMIVWGGSALGSHLNTGGRYSPASNTWVATSTTGVPTARVNHTAIWTGTEMIVWGGSRNAFPNSLNSGGRYLPASNTWISTSVAGAPAQRTNHSAVWTGTEMIVWGGSTQTTPLNTGGRYTPATNTWTATDTGSAPSERAQHEAIWTGTEMIVWGGYTGSYLDTGGRYSPGANTWVATSIGSEPTSRYAHTALWTGVEMIVWGGTRGSTNERSGGTYLPATDSWSATTTQDAPAPRSLHTALWTGSEMIVWGGFVDGSGSNTGGRYYPGSDSWVPTGTLDAPALGTYHSAVWTGAEMIVWGGSSSFQNGGRYSPGADTWVATTTAGAPEARQGNTAVWTGTEMIVWGGVGNLGYLGSGGRYTPTSDSWVELTSLDSPTPRRDHTAIWTGAEMLIWGGSNGMPLNSGGRYSVAQDSWQSTNSESSPAARLLHTAVWSGTEMIAWGGIAGVSNLPAGGGRYRPGPDDWLSTRMTNAPVARYLHTAVWTNRGMIVWGGTTGSGSLADGARYCASPPQPTSFFTLTPCRHFDSRFADGPALASGAVRITQLAGSCGVPATASAVSVNITVVAPAGAGFLQAFAGDQPPPETSAANLGVGLTRANNAIVQLALNGSGSLALRPVSANGTAVHVVVDVNGYFE